MKKIVPKDAILIPDDATCAFKGVIYDVYQWQQTLFDGSSATFEMLKRPDTVSVLCVVDDRLVVLDDEQPHSGLKISFPGGRVDQEDASPLAAAKREVREETGYSFKNWRLLSVKQPIMKLEWFIHYFIASKVIDIKPTNHDAGEKITIQKMDFEKVKELSLGGVRFVNEAGNIFEQTADMSQLMNIPEFSGQEVDR